MQHEILEDRAVLRLSGSQAQEFLQRVITCNVDLIEVDQAKDCALLTPQGKILAQFMIWQKGAEFILDCHTHCSDVLAQRLNMYKLRDDVTIELQADAKIAVSDTKTDETPILDTRCEGMGFRGLIETSETTASASAYNERRISLGLAEIGADYDSNACFPHEVLLEQTGGVDFSKGCYVGQEVVSRVEHRGTARKRFLKISGLAALPEKGEALTFEGKNIGEMGSSIGNNGMALLRSDKLNTGDKVQFGGAEFEISVPTFANFNLETLNG